MARVVSEVLWRHVCAAQAPGREGSGGVDGYGEGGCRRRCCGREASGASRAPTTGGSSPAACGSCPPAPPAGARRPVAYLLRLVRWWKEGTEDRLLQHRPDREWHGRRHGGLVRTDSTSMLPMPGSGRRRRRDSGVALGERRRPTGPALAGMYVTKPGGKGQPRRCPARAGRQGVQPPRTRRWLRRCAIPACSPTRPLPRERRAHRPGYKPRFDWDTDPDAAPLGNTARIGYSRSGDEAPARSSRAGTIGPWY
jgi:hypothetical protein